jgi:nucleotide-binding universal stress UspA family protein
MDVLLGIGGGETARRALEATVSRASAAGDDLTIAILEAAEGSMDAAELEALAEAVLSERAYDADVRSVSGHPGSQLLELAERGGHDRIVLGGGEQSPLGKVSLGPITEYVLLNATSTVTLIR